MAATTRIRAFLETVEGMFFDVRRVVGLAGSRVTLSDGSTARLRTSTDRRHARLWLGHLEATARCNPSFVLPEQHDLH